MVPSSHLGKLVYYSGHVQGVGFRYTACQVATRFAVTGYVRNLPDGRVELVAEGTAAEVDAFLRAVHEALRDRIDVADRHDQAATGAFPGFKIRL